MVMEALVYILTLLFGVSTVIIIKNKRYKVVPFICLDIILTFAGLPLHHLLFCLYGMKLSSAADYERVWIVSVFTGCE